MNRLLDGLRQALLVGEGSAATDAQLLERFLGLHDESALEVLIRRHATMVWGVCRRVLSNEQNAEDAFQATFLVLVRRASSIHPKGMIGNWLYGVAHQTALKARATVGKRAARERQVTDMPEISVADRTPTVDLRSVLDEELAALPDVQRAVIVLCDLEGKSRREVAGLLDVAEGTVASRLARARESLAKRLAGRGVSLSAGATMIVVGQSAATAGVPPKVLASTIQAAILTAFGKSTAGVVSATAAALADTMVKSAVTSKVNTAVAGLFALGFVAGTIAVATETSRHASAESTTERVVVAKQSVPMERGKYLSDLNRLSGQWKAVKVVVNGAAVEFAAGEGPVYAFTDDTLAVTQIGGQLNGGVAPTFSNDRFVGLGNRLGGLNPESRLKLMSQFGGRGGPWAGLNPDQRNLLFDHMKSCEGGGIEVEFGFRLNEHEKSIDRFLTVDGDERLIVRGVYAVSADLLTIWEGTATGSRPTPQQMATGSGCTMWAFRRVGH